MTFTVIVRKTETIPIKLIPEIPETRMLGGYCFLDRMPCIDKES
jgi:hypothetical protein